MPTAAPSRPQSTLNKFLSLPPKSGPIVQQRVDSLLRKQTRQVATTPAGGSGSQGEEEGEEEDNRMAVEVGGPKKGKEDVEEEAQKKGDEHANPEEPRRKKRRVAPDSDDEMHIDIPIASSKTKVLDRVDQGAITPDASDSEKEGKKLVGKPKPSQKEKPKSPFEIKPAAAKTASKAPSKESGKDKVKVGAKSKGKDKATEKAPAAAATAEAEEEDEPTSDAAKTGAEDDEAAESEVESEEEKEVAKKMADIFTRKKTQKIDRADWKAGEPVPYAALISTLSAVEATTKRLEITAHLTEFLVEVIEKTPDDLLKSVYLCINRICPDYEGLELGIGESLLIKAIGESMGRSTAQIKADYKKEGDLGKVAKNSRSNQPTMFKPKPLTISHVFANLKEIAKSTGNKSQDKKVGIIKKMLAACQGDEAKFIIRSLEGKLRIGLAEKSALISLAHAVATAQKGNRKEPKEKVAKDLEEATNVVKAVFSELPSYDLVVPALLEAGIKGLHERCKLTPGVPLKPMLAKPTKAISEVLDRFEGKAFTCEYKYDGERAQIHRLEDGSVKVFSRNSEDMSVKYPDIVAQLPKCFKESTKSFVIDCEAVAWDKEAKVLLPFQQLTTRKRKDVKVEDIKIKVHIFAFDILYLNGEPLLHKDLAARRALLRDHFVPVEGEFGFATSRDVNNVEDIQAFLDDSVKHGCEGLMVKMLEGQDATYEPSRRSMNWLKLKKDYLAGVGDSFDLVVIGGYYGRGKRTNVYGAFLLACYDPDSETYQSICKIGTGFSDEALDTHHKALKDFEMVEKRSYYDVGDAKPDIYFEPKVVWEVLAADLSMSPIYSAAKEQLGTGRGVSLRFPRFIRQRDDKDPDQATGPEQVAEAYQKQVTAGPTKSGKGKDDDGDDFW